ncbi:MAG: zonular occludens toxin domain-containing protein [Candidatus Methanomethylicia archaeon]
MAIVGELGTGKTLSLTFLAWHYYLKWQKSRPIYANYHLNLYYLDKDRKINYIPYKYISSPEELDQIRNGFFAGDELWIWLDSRATATKKNRFTSMILLKSRKRDMDVVYTTQSFGQVDKRVRTVTDFIAFPILSRNNNYCQLFIFTNHTFRFMKKLKFYAPAFFNMYNTAEEIDTETEKAQFDLNSIRKEILKATRMGIFSPKTVEFFKVKGIL